jgi:hypothetical protein
VIGGAARKLNRSEVRRGDEERVARRISSPLSLLAAQQKLAPEMVQFLADLEDQYRGFGKGVRGSVYIPPL